MTIATLRLPRDGRRVPVDVRQEHQRQHRADRDEDPRDERVEVREELLQTGEVPRGLGGLRSEVGIGQSPQAGRRTRRRARAQWRRRRGATTTWRTSRCGHVKTVSSTARSSAVTDCRSTTPSTRMRPP